MPCAAGAGVASLSSRRRGACFAVCPFPIRWARMQSAATVRVSGRPGIRRAPCCVTTRTAAASCSGSSMATIPTRLPLSDGGCTVPAARSSPAPICWSQYPCTGPGSSSVGTIKRSLLAQAVRSAGGPEVAADWLVRRRRTPAQGHLGPAARERNVHGAFAMRARRSVAGKRVVIIDDVMTTGATVEECARVLKRAGALSIGVLTLARALRTGA